MNDRDEFQVKVRRLIKDVQRVVQGQDLSGSALKKIRQVVSEELLERGTLEIAVDALEELDDSAVEKLLSIVEHCSENFYYSTQTFSAIAVPVAIKWHSPLDRSYRLKRVNRAALNRLALTLNKRVGVERVVMDPRPFSSIDLFSISAKNLREYFWGLSAGRQEVSQLPSPTEIRSLADPFWEIKFFVGVQISNSVNPPIFTGTELDHDLATGNCEFMDLVREGLGNPTALQYQCHGVWPLHEALRQGVKALRHHRASELIEMIGKSRKSEEDIRIIFTHAPLAGHVDWIASRAWLRLHGKWPLMAGETLDHFVQDLRNVNSHVDDGHRTLEPEFVQWEEFERILKRTGMWRSYRKK